MRHAHETIGTIDQGGDGPGITLKLSVSVPQYHRVEIVSIRAPVSVMAVSVVPDIRCHFQSSPSGDFCKAAKFMLDELTQALSSVGSHS